VSINLFNKIKEIVVSRRNKKSKSKKSKGNKRSTVVVATKPKVEPKIEVEELDETIKGRPMKLRFSPTAWAKFLFMRDVGNTEVGGFAITMPDDLLYVDDFVLPKQECGMASVEFDNESVADLVDDMIDEGLRPEQFLRIWIHTHPSMSASPSKTDEDTFERVFGKCDWAIMAIISSNGDKYCRLQINAGPMPGSIEIPIEVDYESYDFPASDSGKWEKEYKEKVERVVYTYSGGCRGWPGYRSHARAIPHFESCNPGFAGSPIGNKKSDTEIAIVNGWEEDDSDVRVPLSIPDEILQHLTPNQLSLMETMSPYEREYLMDEIKKRFKIGD
jgi:proteasome lid subunit RPN8/RPN11